MAGHNTNGWIRLVYLDVSLAGDYVSTIYMLHQISGSPVKRVDVRLCIMCTQLAHDHALFWHLS